MIRIATIISILFFFSCRQANSDGKQTQNLMVVEAACGQCQFGLEGKGCDLAVKIDGKAYFVDGTEIDDHGDAHAADGFCETIRKAKVKGEIADGRFKASSFTLLSGNEVDIK